MSSYSSSSASIAVPSITEQLRSQCNLLLAREGAWVSSAEFHRATKLSIGSPSPDRLGHALAALEARPEMQRLALAGGASHLERAKTHWREAREAQRRGDRAEAARLASSGERSLKRAITATQQRLELDERNVVATVAAGALRGLGFAVTSASGTHSTGLWAIRGHEVVAMLVQDGGATEMDTAGCAANACEPTTSAVVERMRRGGVGLQLARLERHGDSDGGQLIQRAVHCGGGAEGVVTQHEVGVAAPTSTSQQASAAVAPTRRPVSN